LEKEKEKGIFISFGFRPSSSQQSLIARGPPASQSRAARLRFTASPRPAWAEHREPNKPLAQFVRARTRRDFLSFPACR
jgi:hypothetical protein